MNNQVTKKQNLSKVEENFLFEEAKIFTNAIFDVDRRISHVFVLSIAASVSLFSWITPTILNASENSQIIIYMALFPNLIAMPAFSYLIAQRHYLLELAAYVQSVERRLNVRGHQSAFGYGKDSIRNAKDRQGEANDPIPQSFWAICAASCCLFTYGIISLNITRVQLLVLVIPLGIMLMYHLNWKNMVHERLSSLDSIWREDELQQKINKIK